MHMQASVFVYWDVKWLDSESASASGPQLELVDCLFQNIKTGYLYMHISTRKQVMSQCLCELLTGWAAGQCCLTVTASGFESAGLSLHRPKKGRSCF